MITHRDALAQLAQARAVQAVAQFRLAHQDDLQQFAVVGLDVREQTDLFEQVFRQILRLVNDQHGFLALLDLLQKKFADGRDRFQPVKCRFTSRPNSVAMAFINSSAFKTGFKISAVENCPSSCSSSARHKRRLARADFAGELDETLALADAVKQMVERLAMFRAVEKKARVRRDVERRLFQSVKLQIHARFLAQSAPRQRKVFNAITRQNCARRP